MFDFASSTSSFFCRLSMRLVVVDGHGQGALGAVLADHVLVEDLEDLARLGQRTACRLRLLLKLLTDDVVAQLHALIADEYARTRNQLAHFMLALAAERAVEDLAGVRGTTWRSSLMLRLPSYPTR